MANYFPCLLFSFKFLLHFSSHNLVLILVFSSYCLFLPYLFYLSFCYYFNQFQSFLIYVLRAPLSVSNPNHSYCDVVMGPSNSAYIGSKCPKQMTNCATFLYSGQRCLISVNFQTNSDILAPYN